MTSGSRLTDEDVVETVREILREAVDESEAEESSFGRSLKACQRATLSLAERFPVIARTFQRRPLQEVPSSPELNETVVRGPLVLSTLRSGSGATSTLARKHPTSNVKIPMDSNSNVDSSLKTRSGVCDRFLFLNDRPQLTDARSLLVQTAKFHIYTISCIIASLSSRTKYDWVQSSSTPNRHHETSFSLSTAPSST